MSKMRNFKMLTAVTLAASMVIGGAMTALAAESGDASIESSGSYEGGEMKYPALSVTLPTIAAVDYDYIADPNGLIESTEAAKYADSEFKGDGGIYFKTTVKDATNPKNIYSEKSCAKTVTNENAQNIDVTVKLEQGSDAGDIGSQSADAAIAYAAQNTFSGTARELYLAVTDGSRNSALTSTAAATLTTMVEGRPSNYEASYDSNGYGYKKKADAAGWRECSFYLTGALNKDAKWGDGIKFPKIKVTWSYKENKTTVTPAAPSVTTPAAYTLGDDSDLDISYSLGAGESGQSRVSDVVVTFNNTLFSKNGAFGSSTDMGHNITIANGKITLSGSWLAYFPAGTYPICVVFDDQDHTQIVNLVVQ